MFNAQSSKLIAHSSKLKAHGSKLIAHSSKLIAHSSKLKAHSRRGVTLLEVLISIFVVAVGLLGIAAMIPLGSFAVIETAKSDRSAALGRSAQHEVRVRKMLERMRDDTPAPTARWYVDKYDPMDDATPAARQFRLTFLIGQPFAIDPLFATEARVSGTAECFECFPYRKTGDDFAFGHPNLARLQLNIFAVGVNNPQQQLAVLNRIFRWQDDLIFDLDEDDPDRRPRQSNLWSNGAVAPYATPAAAGPNPLHAQSNDNFTWMLTAVPDPSELPITDPATMTPHQIRAILYTHQQKTYEVSVVTFYKRDFTCNAAANVPSERFVEIAFQGTGIGGGDAMLTAPATDAQGNTMTEGLAEEYLKVKENEWIMVTGFVPEPRLSPAGGRRRIAKWYRVIRVDDEVEAVAGTFTRQITLAGPDWDNDLVSPTVIAGTARATIIDGAIGVYTTTVTLE
jgi:prepilin-type N-terminal cleavage/methylation domain-containing protein